MGVEATVTTTYLELPSPAYFRPAYSSDPNLSLWQMQEPFPDLYRYLYTTVGRALYWEERLGWSDALLYAQLMRPSVAVLILNQGGIPAGFIELEAEAAEPGTEIVHFGLASAFRGKGLGKHLLSSGIQRALNDGATRVWLHTDNFDGVHAMANYQARGFQAYRTITHTETCELV